jgi:hypothetical protein
MRQAPLGLFAETLDAEIRDEVEQPGEAVEVERHEVAPNDLLRCEQQFADPMIDSSVDAFTGSAPTEVVGPAGLEPATRRL